jgi:hypothetical protein
MALSRTSSDGNSSPDAERSRNTRTSLRTPSRSRTRRSLSTTGHRPKPFLLAFQDLRQLVQVDEAGVCLPGHPLGRSIVEEQPTVKSDSPGKPQWCVVQYDEVHMRRQRYVPGRGSSASPPGANVKIAVGPRVASCPTAVHERELRATRSQARDHGAFVELHAIIVRDGRFVVGSTGDRVARDSH